MDFCILAYLPLFPVLGSWVAVLSTDRDRVGPAFVLCETEGPGVWSRDPTTESGRDCSPLDLILRPPNHAPCVPATLGLSASGACVCPYSTLLFTLFMLPGSFPYSSLQSPTHPSRPSSNGISSLCFSLIICSFSITLSHHTHSSPLCTSLQGRHCSIVIFLPHSLWATWGQRPFTHFIWCW